MLCIVLCTEPLIAQPVYYVSKAGNDNNPGSEAQPWLTIQKGCTVASPGGTVLIKSGIYNEKITVNVSGSVSSGYITIRNYGSDSVIVDGTGKAGQNMFSIQDRNYIKIIGLIIRNDTLVTDGSGIRIEGFADHIELRNNTIYNIRGTNAMGITCYGTNGAAAISNIIIDSNHIYHCEAAPSEALTLNGNVDGFTITNNLIHDINNIGIDMIGGEGMCPVASKDKARNGVCRGNRVYKCRSNYGGGYAAAIYVDGGRNITVENNIIHESDVGIEVGCENHNEVTDSIIVRNNLIYNNDKRGLSFGGYNYPVTGLVRYCQFLNNTVYHNDILSTGDGECHIEYALNCVVRNNVFFGTSQNLLLSTTVGNPNQNVLNYNLWYVDGGSSAAEFHWDGTAITGFGNYQAVTGQDANSIFGNPQLINITLPSPDLHLTASSPARESGIPGFVAAAGELDMDGETRLVGNRVDIGADEFASIPEIPELIAPANASTGHPPTLLLSWDSPIEASSYHIQVAADSQFASLVHEDSSVITTEYQVGPLDGNTMFYWRVAAKNIIGKSPWTDAWSFSTANYVTNQYPVSEGWNLVSLPLNIFDPRRVSIFPTSVSPAYGFAQSSGYIRSDSLKNGIGYWLKFDQAQGVDLYGTTVLLDTIIVGAGWNVIGSVAGPVDTGAIVQIPSGIVQSAYYGYNGSYVVADAIRPANAYWVKAVAPGVLILDGNVIHRRKER